MQSPQVGKTVVPLFLCPTNSKPSQYTVPLLQMMPVPIGNTLGTIDYIYSHGATDVECAPASGIPVEDRGLFTVNDPRRVRDVVDGTIVQHSSNTRSLQSMV